MGKSIGFFSRWEPKTYGFVCWKIHAKTFGKKNMDFPIFPMDFPMVPMASRRVAPFLPGCGTQTWLTSSRSSTPGAPYMA